MHFTSCNDLLVFKIEPLRFVQSRAQPGAVFHPSTGSGYPVIIPAGSKYWVRLVQCFIICLKNSLMRNTSTDKPLLEDM